MKPFTGEMQKKSMAAFLKTLTLSILAVCIIFPSILIAETRKELRILFREGIRLLSNRDYAGAEKIFAHITDVSPGLAEAWQNLGYALMKRRKFDEAKEALKTAILLNPDFPDALNNLAIVHIQEGRYLERALSLAKKAFELDRENASYADTLGQAYLKSGLYREAEEFFHLSIALNPKDATPHMHLGMLFEQTGRISEAIRSYRDALTLDPARALASYRLYRISLNKENIREAASHLMNTMKALGEERVDDWERAQIEEELVCNLKAYVVESALAFRRDDAERAFKKRSEEIALATKINIFTYDELESKKLFYLFKPEELVCPSTGQYFTTMKEHVMCPVHGYSPVLVENIPRIVRLRADTDARICANARRAVQAAMLIYKLEHLEEMKEVNCQKLIEAGYLKDRAVCPLGGNYRKGANSILECDLHK